eukprot:1157753-Pelagomonas_calceolata.AAC.4
MPQAKQPLGQNDRHTAALDPDLALLLSMGAELAFACADERYMPMGLSLRAMGPYSLQAKVDLPSSQADAAYAVERYMPMGLSLQANVTGSLPAGAPPAQMLHTRTRSKKATRSKQAAIMPQTSHALSPTHPCTLILYAAALVVLSHLRQSAVEVSSEQEALLLSPARNSRGEV